MGSDPTDECATQPNNAEIVNEESTKTMQHKIVTFSWCLRCLCRELLRDDDPVTMLSMALCHCPTFGQETGDDSSLHDGHLCLLSLIMFSAS